MTYSYDIPAVNDCKQVLNGLQSSWDNLTLLCHLSGTGVNTGDTRVAFNDLTDNLFYKLSDEIVKKTVGSIRSKAQNAADILTRNLFERTADIGFLCKDEFIREILLDLSRVNDGIAYLRRYVSTYTVYSSALVFDVSGQLAFSDVPSCRSNTCLNDVQRKQALAGDIEFFDQIDGLDGKRLFYCSPITLPGSASTVVGYMVFVFDHLNELRKIFQSSLTSDDWLVLSFVDSTDSVILSSDSYHIPPGVRIKASSEHSVTRLGVHEYLSLTCSPASFQAYAGCGWRVHAMTPLTRAFCESEETDLPDGVNTDFLFDDELKRIPIKSNQIQVALNRSVWNGSIHQGRDVSNSSFSKILLKEIGEAGQKTRNAFSGSISRLSRTVLSSVRDAIRSSAALAMDVIDRSFYERANDCRWWTRNAQFADRSPGFESRIQGVLEELNGLYTVYKNIAVFSRDGTLVASSRPIPLKRFTSEWVGRCCASEDYSYQVSRWESSIDDQPGFVFSSPIFDGRTCIGGIALFFDSIDQFEHIIKETLPSKKGAFSLLVSASGLIMASTTERFLSGARFELGLLQSGLFHDGDDIYMVGDAHSGGYREYSEVNIAPLDRMRCLVFSKIGERAIDKKASSHPEIVNLSDGHPRIDVATFRCAQTWYAFLASEVIEAVTSRGLTSSPGAKNLYYLMYENSAIPVFAMDGATSMSGDVIILTCPDAPESRFGLLVEEVGGVLEVSSSQVKDIPEIFGRARSMNKAVLHTLNKRNDLLMVLDSKRLAIRFGFDLDARTKGSDQPLPLCREGGFAIVQQTGVKKEAA